MVVITRWIDQIRAEKNTHREMEMSDNIYKVGIFPIATKDNDLIKENDFEKFSSEIDREFFQLGVKQGHIKIRRDFSTLEKKLGIKMDEDVILSPHTDGHMPSSCISTSPAFSNANRCSLTVGTERSR